MKKMALVLSLIVAMALGGCTSSPTPTPVPEKITLAMGYIPNVQFTPFYVAVEKGYFADEGIEVEFDYGWETDLLKLVGTGELSFAVASGDQVILARSQGLPVVYVLNWYRRFPVCMVALGEKGIQEPKDLVGKTVGIPATYGASYIGWRALVYATGMDEAKVNLQTIGYTQVASLIEDQVDAAVCYLMNEPVQLRQMGREIDIIRVSDYIDLVSNGLITNERTIAERPELVRSLVRAFLRGLRYTIDHPDEAFAICRKYLPEMEDEAIQRAVLAESIALWRSDTLGLSDPAAWEESQRFMRQIGLISAQVEVGEIFTNEFVEEP